MSKRALTAVRQEEIATYYRYDDGTVVAFGRELEPSGTSPKWIASVWSADPIRDDGAEHLGHLCVDASQRELSKNLSEYLAGSDRKGTDAAMTDQSKGTCGVHSVELDQGNCTTCAAERADDAQSRATGKAF